ncbi:DASH complex subunit Duo1-domain-containing protein [Xylaria flabelliformis]|nr:DASH complex subunit Duo1-domain-containing protein [Xylaria flabelliformis]
MMANYEDSDHEDLLASPSDTKAPKTKQLDRPKTPSNPHSHYEDPEDAREAALHRELEGVRNINELIEGVIGTLERAKGNMQTVSNTVTTASTLLNTWTRILSQTEHNQRLLLNPSWKGASQDLADMESEAAAKAAAAERRAAEEERRRAEVRRRAEEQQRQREAAGSASGSTSTTRGRVSTRGVRGTTRATARGRGIGTTRPTSGIGTGPSDTTSSSISSTRGNSKIGRAFLRAGSRGARGS